MPRPRTGNDARVFGCDIRDIVSLRVDSARAARNGVDMIPTKTVRSVVTAALLLGLIAALLAAAGCGSGTAASPSPSSSPSAGSTAQRVLAFKMYVTQLTPIFNDVSTAVGSLDGAVSGLSKRPDKTWVASAAQLKTAAAGLGTAATDLAAITPPTALQGAHATMVAALQRAQKVLDTTSIYLAKGVYIASFPDIATQIKLQVNDTLKAAWASVIDAVNKGVLPTPTAAP
jgi:hypothetical protein